MLNKSELKKLKTIFEGYPDIEAVYLFGSAASGRANETSDIDLGIIASNSSLKKRKIDLYTDMIKQGFDNTDLVFFDAADLILQFEIIRHNKLIYRKNNFNHGDLFSNTIRKYFDFKPYLDHQRKTYKKRILNG